MSLTLNEDYLSDWFFVEEHAAENATLHNGPILIETISLQSYVEDIIHSYGFDFSNTVRQFHLDIDRSMFIFAGEHISDSDILYGMITNCSKMDSRQKKLLITLSTQASMAKPLEIIMKYLGSKYCVLENNNENDKLYFKYNNNELVISKKLRIIKEDSVLFLSEFPVGNSYIDDQHQLTIDIFIPLTVDYKTEDATFCYTIE
jgi:hypothetical protein